MKKTLVKVAGAVLAASALFFASCKLGVEFGPMSGDSYTKLETPKVNVTAYPGAIAYSWTAVPGAKDYMVQVYADNALAATQTVEYGDNEFTGALAACSSLGISNGAKVEVYVSAMSATAPSRAAIALDSEFGKGKCTAIVPPAGTHALDLAAYENGYSTSYRNETAKNKLSADGIFVKQNKDSVYVNYTAKAYLTYTTALVENAAEFGMDYALDNPVDSDVAMVTVNNANLASKLDVTKSGDYEVVVFVEAGNPYIDDVVVASTKVTYEAFETTGNKTTLNDVVNAAYLYNDANADTEDTTARISWTPVVLGDGTVAPTSYYKVYRKNVGTNKLTAVDGTVTEANETELDPANKVYYIDDASITDPTVAYNYVVVITNNGKYGVTAPEATLAKKTPAQVSTSGLNVTGVAGSVKLDAATAYTNYIEWTVTLANQENQTFKAYVINKDKTYVGTPTVADFADAEDVAPTAGNTAVNEYTIYTDAADFGKYYMLVVVSEEGKVDNVVISGAVNVNINDTAITGSLTVTAYDNTYTQMLNGGQNKVANDIIVTFYDQINLSTEDISEYTYKLYKKVTKAEKDYRNNTYKVTVSPWEEVSGFEMKLVLPVNLGANATYAGVITEADLEDATYTYKVVKSNAEGYVDSDEDSVAISVTKAPIAFTADFDKVDFVKKDDAGKWVVDPCTDNSATRNVKFEYNIEKTPVAEYFNNLAGASGYDKVKGYKDDLKSYFADATVKIYRSDAVNGQLAKVYTEIKPTVTKSETVGKSTYPVDKLSADGKSYEADTAKELENKYTYTFVDEGLSTITGNDYDYILVISKPGLADQVVTLTGGSFSL